SPLCVAGAASRELVTTNSEAGSHAALDPPFSAPLCFPTEGNGHDHAPPAAVS
ncbi:unnamed protein product, partial [Laminaria digitata]